MPELDLSNLFEARKSILLRGPPGSGKTEIAINLVSQWLRRGEKILFVTVSMSGEEILERLFLAGFKQADLESRLLIVDCYQTQSQSTQSRNKLIISINGLSHLESITLAISTAVEALGAPVRVVLDGLSTLFLHNAPQTMAKFVQVLSIRARNEFGFLLFTVVEGMHESVTTNTLMSLADGVAEIEFDARLKRFLRIRYIKGARTDHDWYAYTLAADRNSLKLEGPIQKNKIDLTESDPGRHEERAPGRAPGGG
ncbi:MAG: RAD55 family ATPase [Thermoplasmata archaeon]|nr:RAD55 family ATPase [Candidatus Sysuiplasma acidicola]MBX8646431.1 RAD55 family ATPase [Candidatus Sysuiplasma acidicola]MDH2905681.1 RAD55 family ATPase [Methanomassiliicoccales archaeon]